MNGGNHTTPTRKRCRRAVGTVVRGLAGLYPGSPSTSASLERSVSFLGWSIGTERIVAAGYVAGVLATVLVAPLALVVPPAYVPAVVPGTLAVGLGTAHGIHRCPVAVAAVRRTTALGEAPGIVARAVLRMRIAPTVESAATFAAESGRGPLAASLGRHVRRAAGGPQSGLSAFADDWAEWFPALRRSTGLIVAAADAPAPRRDRTLDRALAAVLEGTHDRMSAFAESVRAPATALYAFGVLLPLALVAVLPAARVAGLPLSLGILVLVYDLLLPSVVVVIGAWLLVRRPVAFPPPAVGRDHPNVPSRRWSPVAIGAGVGVVALVALPTLVPAWSVPFGVLGASVGTTLVGLYRPIETVRRRVRAVESGLPDALYLIGRRIAEGEAVESAIERAAEDVSGETGAVLADAAAVGTRLRVDVHDSLLGEHGALAHVPSPRTRGAAALLGAATREGQPAGTAVVAMAEHLDDLEDVEREARRKLARVTGTLRQTGSVFAPLIAGATVALSGGMTATSVGPVTAAPTTLGTVGSGIDTAALGTVVGVYVSFLAVALTALSTGLERGLDPALLGHRIGWALLSATAIYLGTLLAVGVVV